MESALGERFSLLLNFYLLNSEPLFPFNSALDFASKNIKRFLNYSFKQEFYYKDYPEKALDFLQTQKFRGNILAEYGWGGFVLWYSPSYKVFIDGRMPNWPFKNHKTILQVFNELRFPKASDSESINKYQIEYILLKKTKNHTKKTYFNWPTVYQDSKSVILKNPSSFADLATSSGIEKPAIAQ